FSSIKTIVFDKTGTLTTGRFRISRINTSEDPQYIRSLIYNLEQYSSHPIAKSLVKELEAFRDTAFAITWKSIEEDKGLGINATDSDNNLFSLGSFQMVKHFHDDHSHNLYLLRNNELIATVDIDDEIREGASQLVSVLLSKGITPVLLSGDLKANCEKVARATGIKEVYYEQLPGQKLEIISRLSRNGNTAMVGDGINDAPALSKANLGISFGNATHTAISSAQVVLLQHQDLMILLRALEIGRMTYTTIRQNLFWAFFYNVIAIPVAAFGYLSPMVGAFSMAFSDVVVIGNSLRLKIRNIRNR
ncbi:MAG: cation-translocating P-type ATPase, partial [Bacteroidia bacterium]|nr:cation-translocating P-type ATPase [Bacteroidia bacterium]